MTKSSPKKRDILDVTTKQPERPSVNPDAGRLFLDQFLNAQKADEATVEKTEEVPASTAPLPESPEALEEAIVANLREIYDPEIPVNIYDMGLIYAVDVTDSFDVIVRMTLTTPNCPVAESMPGDVEQKVKGVHGVRHVEVQLVWDPPWDMSLMSDEARLELGLL